MWLTWAAIALLLLPHVLRWQHNAESEARSTYTRPDKARKRVVW